MGERPHGRGRRLSIDLPGRGCRNALKSESQIT
jgi:hypothetical protein